MGIQANRGRSFARRWARIDADGCPLAAFFCRWVLLAEPTVLHSHQEPMLQEGVVGLPAIME
jgi:hypothetical protein